MVEQNKDPQRVDVRRVTSHERPLLYNTEGDPLLVKPLLTTGEQDKAPDDTDQTSGSANGVADITPREAVDGANNTDSTGTPVNADVAPRPRRIRLWVAGAGVALLALAAAGVGGCYLLRRGGEVTPVEPVSTPTPSAAAGTPVPEVLPTQIPAEPTATVVVPTSTASAAAGTPEPEPSAVVGEPMPNVVRVEGVVNFVVSQATSMPVEPVVPTAPPRLEPTAGPTEKPTVVPTVEPKPEKPTVVPTVEPKPTYTPRPTLRPETTTRSCPSADQLGPWEPSSRGKPVEFKIDATDYGTTVIATIWIPGVTKRGTEYLIRIRDMRLSILGAGTAWEYGSRCYQEEIDRQVDAHIARKKEDGVKTIKMSPQQFMRMFPDNMELLRR